MKYPYNTRVLVATTNIHDYYITHVNGIWYVEAFKKGTLDHDSKAMCGVSTLKVANHIVQNWKDNWLH